MTGSLQAADNLNCESIALPAISTGIFGFPKDRAAGIIFTSVEIYFENHTSNLKTVKVLLYDQPTVDVFINIWEAKYGQ